MNRPAKKNGPAASAGDTFRTARRRLLKTIAIALSPPLWAIACRREAGGRQGADRMQPAEQRTAANATPDHRIPMLDTRIPDAVQTATFAMG